MILIPNWRLLQKFIWLCCFDSVVIACATYIQGLKWRRGHTGWIQCNAQVQIEVLGPNVPCLEASTVDKDEMDVSRSMFVLLWYSTVWYKDYQWTQISVLIPIYFWGCVMEGMGVPTVYHSSLEASQFRAYWRSCMLKPNLVYKLKF